VQLEQVRGKLMRQERRVNARASIHVITDRTASHLLNSDKAKARTTLIDAPRAAKMQRN
jgi:hypothetical protein